MNTYLRYAYQVESEYSKYVLLGSLIRAIGKGWKVQVCTQDSIYQQFRKSLRNPDQLIIKNSADHLLPDVDLSLLDHATPQTRFIAQTLKTHTMICDPKPEYEKYDLISTFKSDYIHQDGVCAITGDGKGKTTMALGIAAEAFVYGKKVAIIQWFKERKKGDLTWAINEHFFAQRTNDPNRFEIFPTGLGFFGSPKMDRVRGEDAYQQHRKKAYDGLDLAKHFLQSKKYDLLVLDEFVDTAKEIAQNIEYPLLNLQDLQNFFSSLSGDNHTQIVVTGRRVTADWQQFIQKSIVVSQIKHPWSTSKLGAVSGLDF